MDTIKILLVVLLIGVLLNLGLTGALVWYFYSDNAEWNCTENYMNECIKYEVVN